MRRRGAQRVQPAEGSVHQGPDDRLGGRISCEFVQVALDHGGGVSYFHGATHEPQGGYIGADPTAEGVDRPRLV
jgi:hypothetical protein